MFNRKIAGSIAAAFMSLALVTGCSSGEPGASETPTDQGSVIDPTYTPRPTNTGVPTTEIEEEIPGDDDTGIDIQITPSESASPTTEPTSTTGPGGFTAPPTSGPSPTTSPGGTTSPGDGNFVAACNEVNGSIPKSDPRYRVELDPNDNSVACDPTDRSILANPTNPPATTGPGTQPTTAPTTAPTTTPGGSDPAPTRPLSAADGTVIIARITSDTKIYASPNVNSQAIGEASSGGQFKGTVTNGGYWVKIDRSPGYVKSDAVSVGQVINNS